jgi:hypothetical protein
MIPLKIKIFTGGYMIDNVDAIIKYDPKLIEATSSSIQAGKVFSDYPIIDINPSLGTIRIASISQPGQEGFVGVGDFAMLQLKAKTEGQTTLAFDSNPGSNSDTNVIRSDSEIDSLGKVINLDLTISKNASKNPSSNSKDTCTGFIQYCNNILGQTGKQLCTGGVLNKGECKLDIKQTQNCGPCKLGR